MNAFMNLFIYLFNQETSHDMVITSLHVAQDVSNTYYIHLQCKILVPNEKYIGNMNMVTKLSTYAL
jgi:hypothetical protein